MVIFILYVVVITLLIVFILHFVCPHINLFSFHVNYRFEYSLIQECSKLKSEIIIS